MIQVFRDCSLQAYRKSGARGMIRLWAITIVDWFISVIEEQASRQVEMSPAKLMRLCGWSLMAGPIVLFVGLGEPAQYRDLLLNMTAEPHDPARLPAIQMVLETVLILFILLGLSFIYFGLWGLRKHSHDKVGKMGRISLRLLVVCSGVSLLGAVFALTRIVCGDHFYRRVFALFCLPGNLWDRCYTRETFCALECVALAHRGLASGDARHRRHFRLGGAPLFLHCLYAFCPVRIDFPGLSPAIGGKGIQRDGVIMTQANTQAQPLTQLSRNEISTGKLWWVIPVATIFATIANVVFYYIVTRMIGEPLLFPEQFPPLETSPMPVSDVL
jgi:hypothetical protein